jgi:hypothetical protein
VSDHSCYWFDQAIHPKSFPIWVEWASPVKNVIVVAGEGIWVCWTKDTVTLEKYAKERSRRGLGIYKVECMMVVKGGSVLH